MDDVYEECFGYDIRTTEDDFSDTVSSPATPMTPSTPCTPASDHDTDKSGFSVSLDSGIGSPSPFSLKPDFNHSIIDMHNLRKTGKKDSAKKIYKMTEHTNKEKHRRERIKDSCDQLRVLLPYIRGRKTDMASILEMAVDYLRIVNMCMPQALHDQIVDILSKDESLVPNKESKIRGKKGATKSTGKSTVPPCGDLAQLVEKTSGSQVKNSKDMKLSEIASSCDILSNKRTKLQTDESSGPESFHLDARLEPTLAGHTDLVPYTDQSNGVYGKSYTHHEEKTYSRVYSGSNYNDGFNAAQQIFNTYTANKSSLIEANPYTANKSSLIEANPYTANKSSLIEANPYRPSYSTDPALYHYYPNLVPNMSPQNHLYTTSSDLVSPSNVLSSLSYSSVHSRLENVTMLSDAANKDD